MQIWAVNFSIKRSIVIPFIFILLAPGIAMAQNNEDEERERDSVYTLIYNLLDAAKYTEAHTAVEQALYTYRNDEPFTAALYLAFSDVERVTGNMDIAFDHAHTAEKIIFNQGTNYWNLKKNTVYQRLANLYFESQQYDSAFVYAQKAIYSARDYNMKQYGNMQAQNLPIIGHHYVLQGKYDMAESIYLQAIEINLSMDYICENGNIYEKLSEIKSKELQMKQAVYYAEKAYHIGDSCGYVGYKLAAVNRLVGIYEQFHDYEMVAKTLQLKMKLLEETQLHEQKTRLQEMETEFGTKLKDEENKLLKVVNEEHEKQNRFLTIIIVLSIMTLAMVSLFAMSYRKQRSQILKQKEDVDKLNLLNQKIFSVISHDFKGPMMGIGVLLDMKEKYGMDQETFSNQISTLRNDLSQANLVMDNLLSWSKTELGFSDFEKHTSNVFGVGEEVMAQLRSLIQQKKLSVYNRVAQVNSLPIPPDILKIILRNLLANAIKYSHEQSQIIFEYNNTENAYELRDEGIGMNEQQLNKILSGTTDSRLGTLHESGFGIGLRLVQELVHKYNGRIWIKSIQDKGTSIYFVFN